MPIYEVRSLDVWGNAVDGYEINDQRRIGEVYLRPTDGDPDVLQPLIDAGLLRNLPDDDLQVEISGDGEGIEISELVVEDVLIRDEDENVARDDNGTREVQGERPLLELHRVRLSDGEDADTFWTLEYDGLRDLRGNDYKLIINASFELKKNRWVDGDEPREPILSFGILPMFNAGPGEPDTFDFYFADKKWRKSIGFDPITSEPFKLSKDQISDMLVALDEFMEKGPVMVDRYIAQNYGPQNGYAYELEVLKGKRWNEAPSSAWNTVVVDRDDFGDEVGVVVIDGVEMRVWRADELP